MSADITKEYTNGEITVVWKPNVCIHSAICRKGLPDVFDPQARPWIKVSEASTEEIIKQVDKCPSGAITWYRNDETADKKEIEHVTKVEVIPNGPIRVHGDVEITHSNGSVEKRERITALCRCGLSSNKPFCDGTHKREGWSETA
jgi:uncharacterized Fe-S cluster protein YjdI